MLEVTTIAIGLIAGTVGVQALGSIFVIRFINMEHALHPDTKLTPGRAVRTLILVALFLFCLHLIQVNIWAITYFMLPDVSELGTYEVAVYFSFVTFTTVGYGDVVLGPPWRVLAGVEALNGVLLLGWSTALLFGVMQEMWKHGVFVRKGAPRNRGQ